MLSVLLLSLLGVCIQGCATSKSVIEGVSLECEGYYTKANIWYTNPRLIKSTNYHIGAMIPFGTKVSIEKITRSKIVFRTNDGLVYELLLIRKHSRSPIKDLFSRYFSATDPMIEGGLFASFTSEERENITQGNIVLKMSKEAVLASYGYPPSHATANLSQNHWRFWVVGRQEIWINFYKNRVKSIEVVDVSGPPPGKKRITKVSSLIE